MMNKKAISTVLLLVIIGVLLFGFVFGATANVVRKALASYKDSEDATSTISEALREVSANDVDLKLINIKLDENSAIYFFSEQDAVVENFASTFQDVDLLGLGVSKNVVARPLECSEGKACICLCRGFSFTDPSNKEELENKYPESVASYLKCDKSLICHDLEGVKFQQTTELQKIISPQQYERIQTETKENQDTVNFINSWEGGFSFWRKEPLSLDTKLSIKESARQSPYTIDIIQSKYVDVYIIKNDDGTLGMCFDDDCIINN